MMNIREPVLPGPWYPRSPEKIDEFLAFCKNQRVKNAAAAIAPHAGWYYSGKIAAHSVSCLDETAETIIIIGGHLPAGAPFLFAGENSMRTPYGLMPMDPELRDLLAVKLDGRNDKYQDNTVEVLVPMVHSFFPRAKLLWMRFPADLTSFEAGKKIADAARSLNRKIVVLGSTDLTHYGSNYGYSPKGRGKSALEWVKNTNDAAFIKAVLAGNKTEVLRCADEDRSACSAGAVLGVLGFVSQKECSGELLEYNTSADITNDLSPDSFVGYASIIWK